jgi:hypothetical protein
VDDRLPWSRNGRLDRPMRARDRYAAAARDLDDRMDDRSTIFTEMV